MAGCRALTALRYRLLLRQSAIPDVYEARHTSAWQKRQMAVRPTDQTKPAGQEAFVLMQVNGFTLLLEHLTRRTPQSSSALSVERCHSSAPVRIASMSSFSFRRSLRTCSCRAIAIRTTSELNQFTNDYNGLQRHLGCAMSAADIENLRSYLTKPYAINLFIFVTGSRLIDQLIKLRFDKARH